MVTEKTLGEILYILDGLKVIHNSYEDCMQCLVCGVKSPRNIEFKHDPKCEMVKCLDKVYVALSQKDKYSIFENLEQQVYVWRNIANS